MNESDFNNNSKVAHTFRQLHTKRHIYTPYTGAFLQAKQKKKKKNVNGKKEDE